MFFFIAVTSGSKNLGQRRCNFSCCGASGMVPVTCAYQQLILFFFPVFRFGKRYFVSCPNCGAVYEISSLEGKRIEKSSTAEIDPDQMFRLNTHMPRFCPNCGSQVEPGNRFCPNCGVRLQYMPGYIYWGLYLIIINFAAAVASVMDKRRAQKHIWRIPENTLLLLAVLGGSPAMLATMLFVHHKTRHFKFMAGLPAILILQLLLIYFIIRSVM